MRNAADWIQRRRVIPDSLFVVGVTSSDESVFLRRAFCILVAPSERWDKWQYGEQIGTAVWKSHRFIVRSQVRINTKTASDQHAKRSRDWDCIAIAAAKRIFQTPLSSGHRPDARPSGPRESQIVSWFCGQQAPAAGGIQVDTLATYPERRLIGDFWRRLAD